MKASARSIRRGQAQRVKKATRIVHKLAVEMERERRRAELQAVIEKLQAKSAAHNNEHDQGENAGNGDAQTETQ